MEVTIKAQAAWINFGSRSPATTTTRRDCNLIGDEMVHGGKSIPIQWLVGVPNQLRDQRLGQI